jgi:hypothetical protein
VNPDPAVVKDWSSDIKFKTSTKGHLLNISIAIDPSAFKEIGTRKYWINNNLEIWNYLSSIRFKGRNILECTKFYFGKIRKYLYKVIINLPAVGIPL